MSTDRWVRRVLRALAFVLLAGLAALAMLLTALRIEHTRGVELPVPSGPFPVGRATTTWTSNAVDPLAPAGNQRELFAWLWYPAAASGAMPADYLPAPLRDEMVRARGVLISTFLTRDLSKVRTHAIADAGVSSQGSSYPVVLLRAGPEFSTLAQDLASHGYVVAAIEAPYRSGIIVYPDGRAVTRMPANDPETASLERRVDLLMSWSADLSFAIDRLTAMTADASSRFAGRLDLTRVGVVGHSFNGAVAAQFCLDDPRCSAGIDLDGRPHGPMIQASIPRPFMFLLSDHGDASDPVSRQIVADIQSMYDRLPVNGRHRVAIRGASHFSFNDDGAMLKSQIAQRMVRLFGGLGIDGRRQVEVTAYCVRTFFNAYLKQPPTRMNLVSELYPEIEILD
jgi:predicted dienelactone hydrolase